jgi:hypothetical protein
MIPVREYVLIAVVALALVGIGAPANAFGATGVHTIQTVLSGTTPPVQDLPLDEGVEVILSGILPVLGSVQLVGVVTLEGGLLNLIDANSNAPFSSTCLASAADTTWCLRSATGAVWTLQTFSSCATAPLWSFCSHQIYFYPAPYPVSGPVGYATGRTVLLQPVDRFTGALIPAKRGQISIQLDGLMVVPME